SHAGVRDVMRLAGPRTLALGAVQIVFFVDTYLATGMAPGSLTALVYANQLLLLPLGVFSIAISAAVFPTLSHFASLGQVGRMRDTVQQAIRWILFLTLPTAIVMIVLRRPIVNGLALANSIATLLEAALLFILLASRARLRLVGLGISTLKQVCASLLMGVAMFGFIYVTNLPFDLVKDPPKLTLLLQTILAAGV